MIGLVAKPVAGTVGLVGCTVQGAVNTPGTIQRAATRTKKGGKDGEGAADGFEDDEEEKKGEEYEGRELESEVADDVISMRTEQTVAQTDIEEYNREKAEMNEKLQAIKDLADQGDPNFQEQLNQLIAQTSSVKNI